MYRKMKKQEEGTRQNEMVLNTLSQQK